MLPITNYFTRLFKVYQLKVTEPPSAEPTLDAPLLRSCKFWGIGARITSSSVAPPPVFPFLRHVFSIDTRSVKRRKEEKLGERKDHATWVNRHERLRRTGAAPALRPYRGMKACISCSVPRPPSQQGLGRRGGVRNHGDENQRPVLARRPGPAPRISTGSRGARHREKGFEFRGCRSSATPCKYNYLANLSHTREIPCLDSFHDSTSFHELEWRTEGFWFLTGWVGGGVGGAKGVGVRFSRDDFEGRDERFPCRSVSFGGGIFEITLSSFLFSRSFSRFWRIKGSREMYSMPLEMEISRKLYNLILDQFVKKDFNGGPSIRLSPIPIYFKFIRDKLSICVPIALTSWNINFKSDKLDLKFHGLLYIFLSSKKWDNSSRKDWYIWLKASINKNEWNFHFGPNVSPVGRNDIFQVFESTLAKEQWTNIFHDSLEDI